MHGHRFGSVKPDEYLTQDVLGSMLLTVPPPSIFVNTAEHPFTLSADRQLENMSNIS
jgi:hypothetical protein